MSRLGVWALADNERACTFYRRLGGVPGPKAIERVSGCCLPKVGFLFAERP